MTISMSVEQYYTLLGILATLVVVGIGAVVVYMLVGFVNVCKRIFKATTKPLHRKAL